MNIKGSPFVHLSKAYQKQSAEKKSWQGHQKDFVQTQGQAQDRARAIRGRFTDIKRLKRTYEDKPRKDLGQAKDKKGTAKGRFRGKVQFYQILFCKDQLVKLYNFLF